MVRLNLSAAPAPALLSQDVDLFNAYDPERPDPRQRNVALRAAEVLALTGKTTIPVNRSFLSRFALSQNDQLRVLVCDGASLLAWVGALLITFGVLAINIVARLMLRRAK